jgi:pimeloyl-ACP methyl ester carboxylesterase
VGHPETTKTTEVPTRYLDRPGGRIAYDVAGDGPLVIATPGMGDLRSVYRFLAPALVDAGYRVATADLRGHGESDSTFTEYGDVPTATDMLALIKELGGSPAVLIGNSMSAGSAAWAAAESPELVEGIVLMGPFVRDPDVNRLMGMVLRVALSRPWGPRLWRSQYKRLYTGRHPEDLDAHVAQMAESLNQAGHWSAFTRTARTSHAAVEARLDEVTARTLVVMGERDPDFKDTRAEADFIADRLGGSVVMVPESGHYPQAEYPEVVTPAVLEFLAKGKGTDAAAASTSKPSDA